MCASQSKQIGTKITETTEWKHIHEFGHLKTGSLKAKYVDNDLEHANLEFGQVFIKKKSSDSDLILIWKQIECRFFQ